jgi:ATP-dependent Clp protease ATP-binding subunit ClpC
VESLGYKLVLSDEAKDFIAAKGYDIQYGARPLKRSIQKYLEDEMAEVIIQASISEGDVIEVGFDKENQKVTTSIAKIPKEKKKTNGVEEESKKAKNN